MATGSGRRVKLFPMVPLVIGAFAAGGCHDRGNAEAGAGSPPPAIPVVVATAGLAQVPDVLDLPGHLTPVDSVVIRTRVDGELLAAGFTEGEEVRAGQVLFRLDPRPFQAALALAEANRARDEATLERNRAQLRRYDDLVSRDYVSADDYAQVKANLATATAAVAADEAALRAARLDLDYCTIRAPIAGRSGVIAVKPGNLVKAADNATLTTITRMDPVYVDFAMPERYLYEVRADQAHAIVTIATGEGAGASYGHESRLDFIDNAVDPATGTVRVRATAANPDRSLWPGQFVHVRLTLGTERQSIVVPAMALGAGPDGSYVFVVDGGGHARQRRVTIGRQSGDVAVVESGLATGETVVVDGQSRLRDGASVRIAKAGP